MKVIAKPEIPVRSAIAAEIERLHREGQFASYAELTAAEWRRLYRECSQIMTVTPSVAGYFGTLEGFMTASEARVWIDYDGGAQLLTIRRVT